MTDDRQCELMHDGSDAYHAGYSLNNGPWPVGSREEAEWRRGWLAAMNAEYYDE